MIDNTGKPSRETYVNCKMRGQVETMIDSLKNTVDADRTYMQNQVTLEGWMFINGAGNITGSGYAILLFSCGCSSTAQEISHVFNFSW